MTRDDAAPPRLTPDSPLEDVRAYLRALREEVAELDRVDRAVAREQAIEDLAEVNAVSAPAKSVDAALDGGRPDAADLQGTALALENPEPWPEPVDGAELIRELESTFTRFLSLPDGAAPTLALWTVHAHAHDASPISPVLAITSPEKRCGKTTLLELLSALVPRPLPASNVTAATIFRAVEQWRPTLLVDEADTFLEEGSELRGVLNSGHRRSLAYVVRTVGEGHEPRTFRTWAPKTVALIGALPDTLADRSLEIRMHRRAPDEHVEDLRRDRLDQEMEPLRRRVWTWAREHEDLLESGDPELPAGLHDRERDNWRPLLSIADVAGGRWPERVRTAARTLSDDGRGDRSIGTRLLADIREILEDHPSDRIRSKELVEKLCSLEEAPWVEYKGRGLSPQSLAKLLSGFDVSSKKLRFSAGSYRGYDVNAFAEAFRRYLPSPPSEDPPSRTEQVEQSRSDPGVEGFSGRNTGNDVPPSESDERPDTTGDVPPVPASQGPPGEGDPPAGNRCRECGCPIGPTSDICGRCRRKADDRGGREDS